MVKRVLAVASLPQSPLRPSKLVPHLLPIVSLLLVCRLVFQPSCSHLQLAFSKLPPFWQHGLPEWKLWSPFELLCLLDCLGFAEGEEVSSS